MIPEVLFVDGIKRQVHHELDGRQYVLDDYGQKVYGIWLKPTDDDEVKPDVVATPKRRKKP